MLRLSPLILLLTMPAFATAQSPVGEFLKRPILPAEEVTVEIREYLRPKIPRLQAPGLEQSVIKMAADWEKESERIRQDVLKNVVFRGEAAKWRDGKTKVEWLSTIACDGYRIKKVRYEILPGFWIPALLYEPEKLDGKVPVSLSVNGHDGNGKVAEYKQARCINMAKRGMIVLNVEWLGMGQLRSAGNRHSVMNQLDLCGTSGLAPFYLSMSRGLDLLLAHPNADPKRVAVNGLSGGGWQTITISSLDKRVTLTNPVAGYSSFLTRIDHLKDLGDSEQTPTDLAMYADYIHLTAMMAPRATLLSFNHKDNCCFEGSYAMQPLRDGAAPFFKLFGCENALRIHDSHWPGDHNYGIDNRQALYKMIGDFFYPDDPNYNAIEMAYILELKSKEELDVPLPANNLDMNAIAKSLMKDLPRNADWPERKNGAITWQKAQRTQLAATLRIKPVLNVHSRRISDKPAEKNGIKATYHALKIGDHWTVPAVEMVKGEVKGTTIIIGDKGRSSTAAEVEKLLDAGQRVIAIDLFYFGEGHPKSHGYLWALMLATIGERALGLQANELLSISRWASNDGKSPVTVVADGPRSSVIAIAAAALEEKAIGRVELISPLGSLKQIIETNRAFDQSPELFCFGLLEKFDVKQLATLVAPRPVVVRKADERATKELAALTKWYKILGTEHDPFK